MPESTVTPAPARAISAPRTPRCALGAAAAAAPGPRRQARRGHPRRGARFQRARLPQHLARRHGCGARGDQAHDLLLRREQGAAAVRMLPGRARAHPRGLRSGEPRPWTGTARERLREVVRDYALAIASDYGWCMVRAEDHDLGPDTGRQGQGAEVRDRPGHAPAAPRRHRGRLDRGRRSRSSRRLRWQGRSTGSRIGIGPANRIRRLRSQTLSCNCSNRA